MCQQIQASWTPAVGHGFSVTNTNGNTSDAAGYEMHGVHSRAPPTSTNTVSFNRHIRKYHSHSAKETRENETPARGRTIGKLGSEYKPTDPVYKSSVLD